jgi:hypothetical protein
MTTTLTGTHLAAVRAVLERWPDLRVLTLRQPWADLVISGAKDVENRGWVPPSTLPQYCKCPVCEVRTDTIRCEAHEGPSALCVEDGPFPFRLGIHAGKQDATGVTPSGVPWRLWNEATGWGSYMADPNEVTLAQRALPRGALLGFVTVTGCHHADECARTSYSGAGMAPILCSRWAEPGVYHWTLADPEPLDTPMPMHGRQGLWTLQAAA